MASKMLIGKEIEKADGEVNDTVETFIFLLEKRERRTTGDERPTICKGVLIP